MGKVGGGDFKKRTHTGSWSRIDRIGIQINQWLAWSFEAFFVLFIIYAVVEGIVRGML